MSDKAFQYRTMITSQHKLLDLHVGETYKYRDLIYLFVKRDFTAKYSGTAVGCDPAVADYSGLYNYIWATG